MKALVSNRKPLILASAIAVALAGCANQGQQPTKTQKGAAIGAVAGAVLGQAAGGDTRSTLIGTGIGALAGAAVGNYMDKQEAALRQDLEGTGVEVQRQGDQINLNMPGNVTFDTGRADIKPQFHTVLNDVSRTLVNYEKTMVEVAGHTDSTGSAEFNQRLSEQRANSVRSYLIRQGVMPERIRSVGFGESMPVASNDTAQGRARNRRVELTLIPITREGT